MISSYYRLTKPGIVYSNILTAIAAFLFGSRGEIALALGVSLIVGLSLSIAGAAVLNNVIDRDIDTRMPRTQRRAIPTGIISPFHATFFGLVLSTIGLCTLYIGVSPLVGALTLGGVIVYVGIYTPAKRITPHSTLIGAISGAVPPVVGYVAATQTIDTIALLLFLILVTWQMVHFFAIALYRVDEYRAARLPVLPVHTHAIRTQQQMVIYAIAYGICITALWKISELGLLYIVPVGILSLGWIGLAVVGYNTHHIRSWARRMFFYSLILLVVWCVCLAFA
jgi:heme o synthase